MQITKSGWKVLNLVLNYVGYFCVPYCHQSFCSKENYCQLRIKLLETYFRLISNDQSKKEDCLLIDISKCCQNQLLERFEYPRYIPYFTSLCS